jgi:hypothetical protein
VTPPPFKLPVQHEAPSCAIVDGPPEERLQEDRDVFLGKHGLAQTAETRSLLLGVECKV